MKALEFLELVETTACHVQRARQVQRMLAAKHQRGRKVPDLLIAAAAESSGLVVSTTTQTSIASPASPAKDANGSSPPAQSTDSGTACHQGDVRGACGAPLRRFSPTLISGDPR